MVPVAEAGASVLGSIMHLVTGDSGKRTKEAYLPMSALGQKQTCAVQNGMSALPPKADICSASAHVCFGPI